jgi:prophage DNA circulation protein
MKITDIPNTAWRDALMPASFRGALFHVEMGSKESGRRIVLHEFPKNDIPYPEDMGRRPKQFTVRAYIIAYPLNTTEPLYQRDYRIARNILIDALDAEGPGVLQLPTIAPITVACPQYRWSEEQKLGGYCTFDMTFVEYGVPLQVGPAVDTALQAQADAMKQRVIEVMNSVDATLRVMALTAGGGVP